MTVKEFKEELKYYDEDAQVIFDFDDSNVVVDSWTEDKYGYKTVSLDVTLKPTFISECHGEMRIELRVEK